jgi:hypothetical protein
VAQAVERLLCTREALSSNPSLCQKEAIQYLMFSFTLDTSEHLPLILSLPLSNTLLFSLHTLSLEVERRSQLICLVDISTQPQAF